MGRQAVIALCAWQERPHLDDRSGWQFAKPPVAFEGEQCHRNRA